MIHRDKVTHPLFISITGVCALTIVHSVFYVIAVLIVEMLFMFSLLITLVNTKHGFSTNNLLGAHQEIIMVISKKQTNKYKEKLAFFQSIGIMVIKVRKQG